MDELVAKVLKAWEKECLNEDGDVSEDWCIPSELCDAIEELRKLVRK